VSGTHNAVGNKPILVSKMAGQAKLGLSHWRVGRVHTILNVVGMGIAIKRMTFNPALGGAMATFATNTFTHDKAFSSLVGGRIMRMAI
jgi:hypothetical protein